MLSEFSENFCTSAQISRACLTKISWGNFNFHGTGVGANLKNVGFSEKRWILMTDAPVYRHAAYYQPIENSIGILRKFLCKCCSDIQIMSHKNFMGEFQFSWGWCWCKAEKHWIFQKTLDF